MLVDLIAAGTITAVLRSLGGILFALMFAWIFWRMARSRELDGRSAFSRRALKGLAALALLLALTQGWDAISGGSGPSRGSRGPRVVAAGRDTAAVTTLRSLGLGDIAGGVGDVIALRSASTSPDEARDAARRFTGRLAQGGASRAEIRDALRTVLEDRADSATRASILGDAMAHFDSTANLRLASADSVLLAWADAVRSGDTAAAATRREQVADAVAGERIRKLRSSNEDLQKELAQARKQPSIIGFLKSIANDLGFGFGWLGLYFTAIPVFWRGQTPGKRLMGIRTVRLSGEKIGWWSSFSRFGGYAAGLATGLLGFLQILWDANRQGIQDQIAGTVVVRER
ncbi:MAG: RDD family protein [Candidatus Palauibacterales bacterium]|nr:RDD family protein [Candidatus Palauibacterales bacterium]MDP2584038.1 RDD family protein [Candidatus Palauibacterales bacterium]